MPLWDCFPLCNEEMDDMISRTPSGLPSYSQQSFRGLMLASYAPGGQPGKSKAFNDSLAI